MSFQVTEVQRVLKGADYPMNGEQLAKLAQQNGASQELIDELARIDHEVPSPTEVMEELKGELGGRTAGSHKSDEPHYKDVEGPNFQVNDVQTYLKGADYPMDGKQLAALAKRNGGPSELVELLERVSEVDGPSGVMKQLKDHLGGKPAE
jgi:4-hydroxy-3-methylbut-2-enyl diphosphate reductase IspH